MITGILKWARQRQKENWHCEKDLPLMALQMEGSHKLRNVAASGMGKRPENSFSPEASRNGCSHANTVNF